MKHNRGIRNDTGMPNNVLQSIMEACNGGNIEPPNIAIIRPAAPNFASSPIPFRAIPYIVGNISDIHADTPTIIRKTKCSSVLKQNVLFYKTKRTSVNLFSYPNWHKKTPKKTYFFGAFLLLCLLAISPKITNFKQ